jgi:ribosomal protein S18 acetylase RimI-like enzyme
MPQVRSVHNNNILFEKLKVNYPIPFDLLLLADPSIELVTEYLKQSELFVATCYGEILGVIVLFPLTADTIEVKNIAVKPEFHRQGIGSFLIDEATKYASYNQIKSMCIGTANSSIAQLYLYQRLGFEISDIKKNFFETNYKEPIYENGIQAKHMLTLIKQL